MAETVMLGDFCFNSKGNLGCNVGANRDHQEAGRGTNVSPSQDRALVHFARHGFL